ncbi:MAG: alpha/beta hydrolase [bacterium]|nr:alpha/beta hydrolase [bacterium]
MKKILLVHGWNHDNYTSSGCTDAWSNRSRFVEELSTYFEVVRFNLPGFCGEKEPEHPWVLSDFSRYLDRVIQREKPDIVLGYSFGGAILLHWKAVSGNKTVKTFLVSPAILRRYEKKSVSIGWLKAILPERLIVLARDFYLTSVVRNPYYTKASPVMRETYRNIVGLDLREDLLKVSDELVLIYGEKDSATPLESVKDFLASRKSHHKLHVIEGGGHDIANTHTDELVSVIVNLT